MKSIHVLILLAVAAVVLFLFAEAPMRVTVEGMDAHKSIPEHYALCKATENGKSGPGENLRPTIGWRNAPKDARSFALIISDPDVPGDFADAGKEGKTLDVDMPRQIFYHWALVDIPADVTSLEGGKAGKNPAVGKAVKSDLGAYTNPRNYGGPCPPWNDLRLHHYHFTVYALNVPSLRLKPGATARDAEEAVKAHTLRSGEFIGTYTLNPSLQR